MQRKSVSVCAWWVSKFLIWTVCDWTLNARHGRVPGKAEEVRWSECVCVVCRAGAGVRGAARGCVPFNEVAEQRSPSSVDAIARAGWVCQRQGTETDAGGVLICERGAGRVGAAEGLFVFVGQSRTRHERLVPLQHLRFINHNSQKKGAC